ncbi:MAG: hypothetical protein ACYC7E_15130 [Armatimonadota bacterium]
MKRVLILRHECQRYGRYHYLIDVLGEEWTRQGLEVSSRYGLTERPEADLLFPHIDLTRTPPEYLECFRAFPAVVNREVVDIAKRHISSNLLRGDEDYAGPVIVKTDNNFGGRPEERLLRRRNPLLAPAIQAAAPLAERLLGHSLAWRKSLRDYPVYPTLAAVPAGAFRNPALVVERFLPEREGDRYFLRHYLFLGDHTRSVRVAGTTPFMKRHACESVDEGLPVPAPVLELRRRLGMDYGKIDYVMHEGEVVILDVNRTIGTTGIPEVTARVVNDLAGGIWSLLPRDDARTDKG